MIITFISDTHTKHKLIENDLPGGDVLIHSGDFMHTGYYKQEAVEFFEWFENIKGYTHKILIAGNHDRLMEDEPDYMRGLLTGYKDITYIEDEWVELHGYVEKPVKIWGSPWQPEFYNWAFNLPRNGIEIAEKWSLIPDDVDILVTHGPAFGVLDTVTSTSMNLGCEKLTERLSVVKPKLHSFGHIHGGSGYRFNGDTHSFNASSLNERYKYTNKPMTIDWDPETNEIKEFL